MKTSSYLKLLYTKVQRFSKLHHHAHQIPKASGGMRTIQVLKKEYKKLYKPLKVKLNVYPTHSSAIAYKKGVQPHFELWRHKLGKYFYKFDFTDFFQSFTLANTWRRLKKLGFDTEEISKLFWKVDGKFCLAMGHPTSATLTNILLKNFDSEVEDSLRLNDIGYTRYADDILISTNQYIPPKHVENMIKHALKVNGLGFLKLNTKKTQYNKLGGNIKFIGTSISKQNFLGEGWKARKQLLNHWHQIRTYYKTGTITPDQVAEAYFKTQWFNSINNKHIDTGDIKDIWFHLQPEDKSTKYHWHPTKIIVDWVEKSKHV